MFQRLIQLQLVKRDVKGLKDLTFEGGSPEVRKEAGLPSLDAILPNREIRAPYDHIKKF